MHNPKDLKTLTSKYYNHFFPKYAKLATRIATVSEYSKADISKSYHIDADKIDVVYNGINEGFEPLTEIEQQKTREKFSHGKNYFLFVGSQSPRKNLNRLIGAFDLFKEQTNSDYKLVLVGAVYSSEGDVKRVIDKSKYKTDIIFTGRQPQEELEKIMASAFALAFVPYFEGFGIPIVEAMQCDTPVICSNTTSMPEIAGTAGMLVDPFDVNDIAKAMVELYHDPVLRTQLIHNGTHRADCFSWDRSAHLLWDSITKSL